MCRDCPGVRVESKNVENLGRDFWIFFCWENQKNQASKFVSNVYYWEKKNERPAKTLWYISLSTLNKF
jgi:hypothetical protein